MSYTLCLQANCKCPEDVWPNRTCNFIAKYTASEHFSIWAYKRAIHKYKYSLEVITIVKADTFQLCCVQPSARGSDAPRTNSACSSDKKYRVCSKKICRSAGPPPIRWRRSRPSEGCLSFTAKDPRTQLRKQLIDVWRCVRQADRFPHLVGRGVNFRCWNLWNLISTPWSNSFPSPLPRQGGSDWHVETQNPIHKLLQETRHLAIRSSRHNIRSWRPCEFRQNKLCTKQNSFERSVHLPSLLGFKACLEVWTHDSRKSEVSFHTGLVLWNSRDDPQIVIPLAKKS